MDKLTTIEENVLKYLIKNGSATKGISINIPKIDMGYIFQAVKRLDSLGLVVDCSDTLCASAFLTEKGFSYFDELEKEQYGVYYDEIKKIENSISEMHTLKDDDSGHNRFAEICEIYDYIKGLKSGITDYMDPLWNIYFENKKTFQTNVNIVSERLRQYIETLKQKAQKEKTTQIKNTVKNVFNPQNTVNVNNNIDVNISQTISNIIKLDNSELSAEEKQEIQKILLELEELKNSKGKKKFLEKLKEAGKWIFEKGLPTISAILPYLTTLIQGK